MPNKLPDSIRNMPNFREMRAMGIEWVSKKVLEISPNDTQVLCLLANVFILEGNFKKAEEFPSLQQAKNSTA